jgi:hypothetical protein
MKGRKLPASASMLGHRDDCVYGRCLRHKFRIDGLKSFAMAA